jgi:hypothetical protein
MVAPRKAKSDKLSKREQKARFESVVDHMLGTPPKPHKPTTLKKGRPLSLKELSRPLPPLKLFSQ